MTVTRIAIVGLGKIAKDQHAPAIARSTDFELVAGASPAGSMPGIPVFADIGQLLASGIRFEAVALCQPPQFRFAAALSALDAGMHVLLEKPPAASCAQLEFLLKKAGEMHCGVFAAWHSRWAPGVEPAREWLATRRIRRVQIDWKEDVREWHPGQEWIWQPGGFGIFDPGINALSILTRIIPERLSVHSGHLEQPSNCSEPIAANLHLHTPTGIEVTALFDWRQKGKPSWSIEVETEDGQLELTAGGAALHIGGRSIKVGAMDEYAAIYARFATLVRERRSEVDAEPLRLVADALVRCQRQAVDPFHA